MDEERGVQMVKKMVKQLENLVFLLEMATVVKMEHLMAMKMALMMVTGLAHGKHTTSVRVKDSWMVLMKELLLVTQ
jgi:hypothetical protein